MAAMLEPDDSRRMREGECVSFVVEGRSVAEGYCLMTEGLEIWSRDENEDEDEWNKRRSPSGDESSVGAELGLCRLCGLSGLCGLCGLCGLWRQGKEAAASQDQTEVSE